MEESKVIRFIHETTFSDLPDGAVRMTERCCLDLIGVAIAGQKTALSQIITEHARRNFGSESDVADIPFTGCRASPIGAALAMGMAIDSVDAHDGHSLTKGHAGAAVLPAALAFASWASHAGRQVEGREFLTMLAIGYEVSLRAGICLHATACDYHTSGAWNAIGCAAIGARCLKLSASQTRHALGIAEYHGPRSQMMRCIDHPTMLKDGSGWGAMAGVSAAFLAESGFTGAPAVTIEYPEAKTYWMTLGKDWELLNQYFKPYPVCRWAQPAIQAIADLMDGQDIDHASIEAIHVRTFHEALRLAGHEPTTTEEAQYAIAFPIAAFIVFGDLGVDQISGAALHDAKVLALSRKVVLSEANEYNARFPTERWADVRISLTNGKKIVSSPTRPRGDPDIPMSEEDICRKFDKLCSGCLSGREVERLRQTVGDLKSANQSVKGLLDCIRKPIGVS